MIIQQIPKQVSRTSLYLKCFLAFMAGTVVTDGITGLRCYFGSTTLEHLTVRPTIATLGFVFVVLCIIFIIFVKTRWDKREDKNAKSS